MIEIKVQLTESCDLCKGPVSSLMDAALTVDLISGKTTINNPQIPSDDEIVLRPDYNAHGVLMGYHVAVRKVKEEWGQVTP